MTDASADTCKLVLDDKDATDVPSAVDSAANADDNGSQAVLFAGPVAS